MGFFVSLCVGFILCDGLDVFLGFVRNVFMCISGLRWRVGLGVDGIMVLGERKSLGFLILVSLICLAAVSANGTNVGFTRGETGVAQLPSMTLTIVDANGTQVILNETDIGELAPFSGFGGFKNQLGILKGYGNYTGVPLKMICDLVGGLTNSSIVRITASDEYSMNFTYAEVMGEFVTYDNVTGAEIGHSQPLVPIVAYLVNGSDIPESDGPLRIAIVSPEGFVTPSTYWAKLVVRIEVIDSVIPEFQYGMLLSLFLLASFIIVFGVRVQRQRRVWRA